MTPGNATSEFRATKWGLLIGLVLQILGAVLDVLPQIAGEAPWMPAVMLVGGTILQAAAIAGYQVSRGIAKSGQPPMPPPSASVTINTSGQPEP